MTPLECAKDRFQFHLLQMLSLRLAWWSLYTNILVYPPYFLLSRLQSIYESKAWARWNDPALKAQPRENHNSATNRKRDLDQSGI